MITEFLRHTQKRNDLHVYQVDNTLCVMEQGTQIFHQIPIPVDAWWLKYNDDDKAMQTFLGTVIETVKSKELPKGEEDGNN